MNGDGILVVEDEGITAMALEESLLDLGYHVAGVVETGEEAVTLAMKSHPKLVLMDIRLKGKMDGIEAATRIRANQDIPIVYLTAHTDKQTLARAKLTEPYGYLLKPFDSRELKSNIEIALHKYNIEKEIRANSEELRFIVNSVNEAIITADETGCILFWNLGAEEVFGYGESEVFNQPVTMLMPEKYRLSHSEGLRRVSQSGHSNLAGQVLELEGQRKNGQIFPMEMSLTTWSRAGKRYFVGVIRDITERRRLEQQEHFASFQSGVAEMSVAILHNIGNAIMSISHRAEKMVTASRELEKMAAIFMDFNTLLVNKRQQGESDHNILNALEGVLVEVGERLKHLGAGLFSKESQTIQQGVNHISEIIKIHQETAQPAIHSSRFNLAELVDNALRLQLDHLDKHQIRTQISTDLSLYELNMPRSQMVQFLVNLVKNSAESILERRRSETVEGLIQITAQSDSNGLEIRVVDNGQGIAHEQLENIFSFGFTTKNRGTGYGLHSAATFIQSLNGSIHAESRGLNTGAEMVIRLPKSCLENSHDKPKRVGGR
ncbi:MAG: PAS domain S-box protein [Magnetococcales bacterium]|nr:PAS domain S-box protein [Magnetococcales bacterium]